MLRVADKTSPISPRIFLIRAITSCGDFYGAGLKHKWPPDCPAATCKA